MAHINNIRDADVHFTIDPITRAIKNAASTKTSVIQYDHNSERFTFMLPRYIEGHDMMECNQVEVHYINASSAATSGVYIVDDMRTDETEENVLCSWLLSQNVTQEAGLLHFLLRFACVADDGSVEYAWNTGIYKGMSVASGMYNSGEIIEQYADVLAHWERELFKSVKEVKDDIYRLDKNDFELIASGETTEDVQSIIISTDNDGNPFELCDMINIYMYCPIASINSANTALSFDFGKDWMVHQTAATAVNTTAVRYTNFRAVYTGTKWDCQSAAINSGVGALNSNPSRVFENNHNPIVRQIKIYIYNAAYALPAGFKYEIYGRRVKNANS